MKKIGKFFALTGLSLATLVAGTSCFLIPNLDNKPDDKRELTIEDVIIACEQLDYASIEIDMEIDAEWKEQLNPFLGGWTNKKSFLGLEIKENLQSKEGDYLTTKGESKQKSDYYIRDERIFTTGYYFGKSADEEIIYESELYHTSIRFSNILKDLKLEKTFKLGDFEKKEFPMEDVGSFLTFANEYDAVTIEEDMLTFDLNKLIYNVINEVGAAFEGMDKNTTLGDIYAKTEIKNLIDNLSGDDDALTIYNDLAEEDMMAEDGPFAILNDYKPQAGQSFYEYISVLLSSSEFMQECGLNELFEEANTIGDMVVYDLLGETEEEAEETISELVKMFEEVTEDEFLMDLSDELGADFVFSMKDFVVTIALGGDDVRSYHAKGELVFKDDALTGQDMKFALDVAYTYFQEEQPLQDLREYSMLTYKSVYQDGAIKGYATIAAPGDNKVLVPTLMVENEEVVGMKFIDPYQDEDVVMTTYNPKKDVYEYTYAGQEMCVRLMPCNDYHLAIEFYVNDGSNTFFNYSIVYMTKVSKEVYVSYEEYLNPPKEEKPTNQELVYGGLHYRYDEFTDSYVLLGFRGGYTTTHLVIPDTVNGKPVRAIASGAFKDDEKLRSVVIPASVDYVSYLAFESCSSLTTVESYASVLGDNAFFCCGNLETVTLKGVTVLKGAIGNSHKLESVVIGKGVSYIQNSAFRTWNISTITFEGAMTEWEAIEKGKSWGSDIKNVVCSDGTIEVSVNS